MEKAKESAAGMAKIGPNTTLEQVALANTQPPVELVANAAPVNNTKREQELSTLKEELATQEALRGKEREQKKAAEE